MPEPRNPLLRLIKNVLVMVLFWSSHVIYSFVSMAIIARYFGPSLYGVYAFIFACVYVFIPIINFGITPIMVREMAVRKAAGSDYFGSGLAFRLILAGLALLVILALLPFLELTRIQQLALLIFFLSEFSLLVSGMLSELFISFERMEIKTYLYLVNRGLSLALLLAISHFDLGFLAVFLNFAVVNILILGVAIFIAQHTFLRLHLVWRPDLLLFWFKAAWPMAISLATLEYFLRVDVFILRIFRDPAEIAYFEAPYKIISNAIVIAAALGIALSPALARLAQNSLSLFRPIVEQCLKILLILLLPLAAAAIILGPQLMVPLLGAKFALAEPAMAVLSWCILFSFFEPLLTSVLISINKVWVVMVIHLLALVTDLICDLLWVPRYGYLGACYANIVAYGVMFVVSLGMAQYFLGRFSFAKIAGRVLPLGALLGAGLYLYNYLSPWKEMRPGTHMVVGICLALVFYPLLLVLGRAITREDVTMLKEALGKGQ